MTKLIARFFLFLLPAVALVILGFLTVVNPLEEKWISKDLANRSKLISGSIQDSFIKHLNSTRNTKMSRMLSRLIEDPVLAGALACTVDGKVIGRAGKTIASCQDGAEMLALSPEYFKVADQKLHRTIQPILDDRNLPRGFLVLFHDPISFSEHSEQTRQYTVLAFLLTGIVVSILSILIYRQNVNRPVEQLSQILKAVLKGDFKKIPHALRQSDLAPLVTNLDKVLNQFRLAKSEVDLMASPNLWTAGRLRSEVQRLFPDSKVCVIANREPYIHNRKGKNIEVVFPASGLVTALEPIVRACSGLWIGHASGSADRETADENGVVLVPPGKPEYALKRVWLTKEEEQGYYYGFANEGLWPLCHIAHTRPTFRLEDWKHYNNVNQKFAQAFVDEMKGNDRPAALIQDYHYALLPSMIRKARPDAVINLFWHVPWPNPEAIAICPWKKELLRGMLGSDVIGFHTQYHCNNFLDTVDRFLEARVNRENFSVTIKGHTCYVKPFPIGIEYPPKHEVKAEEIPVVRQQLLEELGLPQNSLIGIGVDRVDYTKGIIERFLSVERLLEQHPELIGRFSFIQIGAPSRTQIKRYQDLNFEVQEVAERINRRFSLPAYSPIILRLTHHNADQVFKYYLAADLCYVSSLHDGMNLVAKEYIAARSDFGGALVLSSFTGAARELTDSFIVNPYDTEQCAEALYTALTTDPRELRSRMIRLRDIVSSNNIYAWASNLLNEVHRISQQNIVHSATAPVESTAAV